MAKTAIRMDGITKYFGSVAANKDISFSVCAGEIHALLGENGAGKSTLMNILSGVYRPDSGNIYIDEQKVQFLDPRDSIEKGIGMIHQHFKLVEVLSAKENIIIGRKDGFFLNQKKTSKNIVALCKRYGFELDPDKKVYDMAVSEKQTVEIVKVLYKGARILILDEPTAVLTPQESEKLFKILRTMRDLGSVIIIITHKLSEVMDIADRITVIRKGETVKTVNKAETTKRELTDLMVGRPVELHIERPTVLTNDEIFKIQNLTVIGEDEKSALENVSFGVSKGEIMGIAAVAGSGQKELCEAIAGLTAVKSGDIIYQNESIVGCKPREIIKKGISMSFIPEDRLGMGLVASMDLADNIILKEYNLSHGLFIDRKSAVNRTKDLIERLNINTPSVQTPVKMLSGGNIQKVLVGRELSTDLHVLVTAYPVRGLDINSSYTIYDMLNEQKKKGVAIIFVGEDLDVLMELCDRITVLYDGKVIGTVDPQKVSKEEIGLMMTGGI